MVTHAVINKLGAKSHVRGYTRQSLVIPPWSLTPPPSMYWYMQARISLHVWCDHILLALTFNPYAPSQYFSPSPAPDVWPVGIPRQYWSFRLCIQHDHLLRFYSPPTGTKLQYTYTVGQIVFAEIAYKVLNKRDQRLLIDSWVIKWICDYFFRILYI